MQLRVYRSQRRLECGLVPSNRNIGFGAIEIEVDDKGLVGHVTDSTDDLAQFVRARVRATKTTKGAGVGNRCGKRGSGCTCHGRLNNWMLDPERSMSACLGHGMALILQCLRPPKAKARAFRQ